MKSEAILYTGLSALQKKVYKGILTKDVGEWCVCTEKASFSVLVRLFLSGAAPLDYGNAPLEFSRICSILGLFCA